jgi:outer membrane protein assembly factor BamE
MPPCSPCLRAIAFCLLLPLAGCSQFSSLSSDNFMGFITPYRLEIVQGNVVTSEMAAGLKPGLTRAQA